MNIAARVVNTASTHSVDVETEGRRQPLAIAAKTGGGIRGSSVNGGELLFAALATCFCNDLFREAAKRQIELDAVEVEVRGAFGGPGEPARAVTYSVRVQSTADERQIADLVHATDTLAEIHNTLRRGCPVRLVAS